MNTEIFAPKYNIRFYLTNFGLLIFGAFFLTGIWNPNIVLIEKIGLALLGGLFLYFVVILLSSSITEVHLGSNGILVKRPWRPDMSFRYDHLSAIDRHKISFVDREKKQVGDALIVDLIFLTNGDELIELFQKRMIEGTIRAFRIESRPEAKDRAKKEFRERFSTEFSERIRGLILPLLLVLTLLFLIGLGFMLKSIIRQLFGVEIDLWLSSLAAAIVIIFLLGMAIKRVSDMDNMKEEVKEKVEFGLLASTFVIVLIISGGLVFLPIYMLFGLDGLSNPWISVPTFFVVIISGTYLAGKIVPRLPWMK